MGFVADHEVIVAGYAGPWTVWIVGRDRRVPLVGLLCLSGDVQPPVDVPDFEDLVLENDLLAFPRPSCHSHFAANLAGNGTRSLNKIVGRSDRVEGPRL
jgi:hypothetical protein